jgi:dTDP-4-amino-4,6-dideoxygalactose transaminase
VNGKDRDEITSQLSERKIPSMIYYPVALHQTKAYNSLAESAFPVSEWLASRVLSLPMHTELTTEQLQYITESLAML